MSETDRNAFCSMLEDLSIRGLSSCMERYDDGRHDEEMSLIMAEVSRRDKESIEKRMDDLGERA